MSSPAGRGRRWRRPAVVVLAIALIASVTTLVAAGPASAATPVVNETAQLLGSDSSGNFGQTVSAAGNTVVAGDPSHSAVYLFTRPSSGWSGSLQETAKLTGTATFGTSVALSADGSTLVVGAPGSGTSGTAHLYVYFKPASGWTTGQSPDRTYSDGHASFNLGQNALLGERVVIAPDGSWVGGLEFYNGSQLGTPSPSPGVVAMFSTAPAVPGSPDTYLWVGNDLSGLITGLATNDSGSAVFASAGAAGGAVWRLPATGSWAGQLERTPDATLTIPALTVDGATAVAASGDEVVLSDPSTFGGGKYFAGGAYVFKQPFAGWSGSVAPTATLTPSDPSGAEVGTSAAFSGDQIALAAPLSTVGANAKQGQVYLYQRPSGGWANATESYRMVVSNGAANDQLANYDRTKAPSTLNGPLAMTGNYLVVGAPFTSTNKPISVLERTSNLAVSKTGTGSGTVSGGGIDCGVTCASIQIPGADVTLSAAAAPGSVFTGWSGGGCSGIGSCTVTMSGDRNVTATFTASGPTTHSLDIASSGSGAGSVVADPPPIDCPGTCSALLPGGTQVTLTAKAAPGSVFTGWSGSGCSGTDDCTVTLDADQVVKAAFTRLPELDVARAGAGSGSVTSDPTGIACPGSCASWFPTGAPVTLTATPAPGSVFTGWSGACSGAGSCSVTMTADRSVTATFARTELLVVTIGGSAAGSVTSDVAGIACPGACSSSYKSGTTVTLTAKPDTGNIFDGWSGAGCSGTSTCVVTLTDGQAVTATFSPPEPVLSVSVNGSGTVTSSPAGISCPTSCSQGVPYGFIVVLKAVPGLHSTFTGWSGTGCSGTGLCYVIPTGNHSITANFVSWPKLTVQVTGSSGTTNPNDKGGGLLASTPAGVSCANNAGSCSAYFPPGSVVTLQATPSDSSTFHNWSACPGTPDGQSCTVTMTSDQAVTADFLGYGEQFVEVDLSGAGSGFLTLDSIPAPLSPDYCAYPGGSTMANPTVCVFVFRGDQGFHTMTLVATPTSGDSFSFTATPCPATGNTCTLGTGVPDNGQLVTGTFSGAPTSFNLLQVGTGGTGTGTVTGNRGSGIHCPGSCSQTYPAGNKITLTETPSPGSTFTGWTGGGCTGTSTTCVVTMDSAQSVTAAFAADRPAPATVTVTLAGSGLGEVTGSDDASGISCPEVACSQTFQPPATLTLTAAPALNAVFTGWSGACSGTAATCTINATSLDKAVTATFKQYAVLTVHPSGSGTGKVTADPQAMTCPALCSTYSTDASAKLTQTPDPGSYFAGWSGGGCTGTASTCTVPMSTDQRVTPTFELLPTLTVSVVGDGTGTVSGDDLACPSQCSAAEQPNAPVAVTATPDDGSTFGGWSDATCGTALTCTVSLAESKVLTAQFDAVVDTSAPTSTITLDATAPNGNNGWYVGPVGVTVGATDPDAGDAVTVRCQLDGSTPSTFGDLPGMCSLSSVGTDGLHTVYAASRDAAGNTEAPLVTSSFKIDQTPPSVQFSDCPSSVVPLGSTATVHWSASDSVSGLATAASGSLPLATATVGQRSASAPTATDLAGNNRTGVACRYTVADLTAPSTTITLTPSSPNGTNGWYTSSVGLTISASDVDDAATASCVADPSSVPSTYFDLPAGPCSLSTVGANGAHTVYAASEDSNGNVEAAVRSATFKIDSTKPTVQFTDCPSTVLMGSTVAAHWTAGDTGSGLATAASGSTSLSTATAGSKSVTASATDKAGNASTSTCTYTVTTYGLGTFLSPAPTSKWKRGQTVPVKITVVDSRGMRLTDAQAAALATAKRVTFSGTGAVTVAATPMKYDAGTHQFIYNWKIPSNARTGAETIAATITYPSTTSTTVRTQSITITP